MRTTDFDDSKNSSLALLGRILDDCHRFEGGWMRGERPRIEDFLAGSDLPVEALLPRVLALELSHRHGLGERPKIDEYLARFPQNRSIVEEAFASQTVREAPPVSIKVQSDARSGSSRDLLVGILALQNGFIDHVALIRAIQTWARDKKRPLGSILVEEGKLDAARLGLLEALAAEHRLRHGNDLQTSLAAFGSLGPVLQAVKGMGDPDLEASFAGTIGPGSAPEETIYHPREDQHAPAAAGSSSSSVSRFQDFRFHRAGGLGKVFNALDQELNRRVAFKEIQDQHAHKAQNRDQFMLEGLITGGLEHPGIVPVYSLGCRDDGSPYYAMRFIQGPSLTDKIGQLHAPDDASARPAEEDRSTLPRLLRYFVNACHAIAYAHSRGVLHRDLKPDHVMLGPFGETLVVDWGLAIPIPSERDHAAGGGSEETLHLPRDFDSVLGHEGMIIGTPAYMSPEQAKGQISRLDRASDVYSLGAVLYTILTGKAPYHGGDFATLIEKARLGDFPSPRQVKPNAPAPLEAVCLKAMAFNKEDRYATAGALARDLERWLDDEPVEAYPEPWSARAGRWVRRHRTAAVGAATTLVFSVIGLTALNIQTSRANTVIAEARGQAETHFAQAVDVARSLLADVVHSDLPKVPGAEALWRSVAQKSASKLEELQAQRSDDPKLLASASGAYRELGNILRLFGDDGAAANYRRAIELLRKAMRLDPANPVHRDRLAELLIDAAEAERTRGRPAAAEPLYQEAARIAANLAEEFPNEPNYRRTNARALYNPADLRVDAGDYPKAVLMLEDSVRIMRPFADSDQPGPSDKIEVVLILKSLGTAINGRDGSEAAVKPLEEAVQRAEAILKKSAGDPDARSLRDISLIELARALFPTKPDEAIARLDEAVRDMQKLNGEFPETEGYQAVEAAALEARGARALERKRPDDALADLTASRDILTKLLEKSPKHPAFSSLLGRVLDAMARISHDRGDPKTARALLKKAVELQRIALEATPRNPIDLQAADQHQEALRRLGPTAKEQPIP